MIEIKTKKHPDMDGISFCLRAMSKDKADQRIHIQHALVSDGFLLTTDGKRLHRYKLQTDIADGMYRVFKVSSAHIVLVLSEHNIDKFPECGSLFDIEKVSFSGSASFYKDDAYGGIATVIRNMAVGAVNTSYLEDLGDFFEIDISEDSKEGMLFKCGQKTAVIMAMRDNQETETK